VGVVGLGEIGSPIARRLQKNGIEAGVCDPHALTQQAFLAEGGRHPLATPLQLAQLSQVILLAMPDDPSLREVIIGNNGLMLGVKPGSVVVDLTSTNPDLAQSLANQLVSKGVHWVEASLLGSDRDIRLGQATLLVGGNGQVLDYLSPLFAAMSSAQIRTGGIGSASLIKSMAGLLGGLQMAIHGEVLLMAKRAGIEPAIALQVMSILSTLTGTPPANLETQVFTRSFDSNYSLDRLILDIQRALVAARRNGTPAPLSAGLLETALAARLNQGVSGDYTDIVKWQEKIAHAELHKQSIVSNPVS
jgi:3-hydroxyisobutyrate dehydrogenase-like beta-hydroxyacid dehydrogenase